jgi:ArsR family transcriptional regulator
MYKKISAEQLAKFMQPLGHFMRVQIIEELRLGELDVTTLQKRIGLPQSTVSQHLAILKTNNLIKERKEGRRVLYHLVTIELAEWLLVGIDLLHKSEQIDGETNSII